MSTRYALSFLFPAAYWAMVLANVAWVRRRTGTAPPLSPGMDEERLLRIGWHMVIACWFLQPAILLFSDGFAWTFRPLDLGGGPWGYGAGATLGLAGLALTKWCHGAMGVQWRMWIDPSRPASLVASGPFRWVRHPIYASQILVFWGTWLLAPTPFLAAAGVLHLICVRVKAGLEERYLVDLHGEAYRAYQGRTGRFFPRPAPRA